MKVRSTATELAAGGRGCAEKKALGSQKERLGLSGYCVEGCQQVKGATTLDRLHAAMLLQASGHAGALRALIHAEQERGPTFLRLANALTALYSRGSQEKRLLDAMLLAVPK